MKVKLMDVKRALDAISDEYTFAEDSLVQITVQEDDPGSGKIGDIVNMLVKGKAGNNSLEIEIYGCSENRPARVLITKELVPTVKVTG